MTGGRRKRREGGGGGGRGRERIVSTENRKVGRGTGVVGEKEGDGDVEKMISNKRPILIHFKSSL